MAAGKKLAMLVSFLLCLLGAVMIIGALSVDKWQAPIPYLASLDSDSKAGLRQECSFNSCKDYQTNTTDCCTDENNPFCKACLVNNDRTRSRVATMGLSAVACIFFLIGAILEAVGLIGKGHSKSHHGIAILMLLTMLLAFAAVGVYGLRVASVEPITGDKQDANPSDSLNLVAISGAVALVIMVISLVFIRK